MKYSKVRFTSKQNGNTATIILTDKQQESMTISQISALFPMREACKMERFERGPFYGTFEEAFAHDIDGDRLAVADRLDI